MLTLQVPNEYGYVLLSAVSTFFVSSWLGARITPFRKAGKVPYPYEYASYEQIQTAPPEKAKLMDTFNRAQRGHQNFNENHLSAVGSMLIAGLNYPVAAATLGAVWSVNRVIYAIGYTSGGEKGRYYGILWMLAHYAMLGYAGKSAYDIAFKA